MRRLPFLPAVAGGVALVAFLVLQLATGARLGLVRDDLTATRRELALVTADDRQAEDLLAERRSRLEEVEERLDGLIGRLRALERALSEGTGPPAALLLDLAGTERDLDVASSVLSGRRAEVGALRECFLSVSRALALVSLDDRPGALDVLGSAAPRCRAAEAAT
jgi:hypothetical protein